MNTSQGFLGNGATPYKLEHDGRTYHFRRLDQRAMEALSAWAIERHRKAIVAVYGSDPEELARRLDKLGQEVIEGVFEFYEDALTGKDGGLLFTKPGLLAMLSILCSCPEGELISLLAARHEEVMHFLRLVLAESIPGYGRPADPNVAATQPASG